MKKCLRCYKCRKKITFEYIECKCNFIFCSKHILPFDHSCSYDHRAEHKDKIRKQNPKILKEKFEKL